jgi:transposase
MNQSERRRTIENQYLSTRVEITIPELALIFGVSENTIKADLLALEVFGVAYCANPDGKPQKWYATQPTEPDEMSLELAFALKNVKEAVRTMLPAELYEAVSPMFEAANETYQKKQKANHQSKVVRFERSVASVDFSRHVALNNITVKVLESVKSAICSGNELKLEVDDCEHTISHVSVFEVDGDLYIKGKSIGMAAKAQQFLASEITAAREIDQQLLWHPLPRAM